MNLDPNTYKKNYEALLQRYPDLALVLSTVQIHYQLVQPDGCLPNVVNDGQFLYQGSLPEWCDEHFKGFEMDNVKIPIFMGLGLGYEIIYWMGHYSPKFKSQAILIFEHDLEMFQCAMNVTDLTSIILNPHIYLFVGIRPENLYNTLRQFYTTHLQELLMCGVTQPVFLPLRDRQYYMSAIQILYEAMYHSIQNFGNCPEDSLIGLENMLDNIKEIAENPGINSLYGKFKDKPAIIVATGPSLKKNVQLLKGLEDKALIISCDASFKYLMSQGIKPHLITSLEREHEVQQFFDNMENVEDCYMAACPVLFNHVYESYNGPKIIVYRNFDHFKWLGIDKGILDIKLSSSNMAFKIAEALGCNPIILVGQDLAYGPDGETHATEVPFSSEGEGVFEVKGNYETVKTNTGWYGFLKAYEYDIASYKGIMSNSSNVYGIPAPVLFAMRDNLSTVDYPGKEIILERIEAYLYQANSNNNRVINCTEGGAFIQGTKIQTLADVIPTLEPFNPLGIIRESLTPPSEKDTEHLKSLIDKTLEEIQCIINLCITGHAVCELYKEELKGSEGERLDQIRNEIIQPRIEIQSKYTETFQKFLMHVLQSVHLKAEMQCAMMTDPREVLLKMNEWYEFVGDICEICLQSLQRAKDKIYGIH
jgi:hypothetical protein